MCYFQLVFNKKKTVQNDTINHMYTTFLEQILPSIQSPWKKNETVIWGTSENKFI